MCNLRLETNLTLHDYYCKQATSRIEVFHHFVMLQYTFCITIHIRHDIALALSILDEHKLRMCEAASIWGNQAAIGCRRYSMQEDNLYATARYKEGPPACGLQMQSRSLLLLTAAILLPNRKFQHSLNLGTAHHTPICDVAVWTLIGSHCRDLFCKEKPDVTCQRIQLATARQISRNPDDPFTALHHSSAYHKPAMADTPCCTLRL